MKRKPLISLYRAQELYGVNNTTFIRPRYVPEGACEWCGSPLPNKRRKSCCGEECNRKFLTATCAVMYANFGSAGGYRNHIFRRDDYTCQMCGEPHRVINENGIPLPTTEGGTDAPENLITLCRECHKKVHRVGKKG